MLGQTVPNTGSSNREGPVTVPTKSIYVKVVKFTSTISTVKCQIYRNNSTDRRFQHFLTLSLLVPSQRRVLKPSCRTNTFAAKGYRDLSVTAAKSTCNCLITILQRFVASDL